MEQTYPTQFTTVMPVSVSINVPTTYERSHKICNIIYDMICTYKTVVRGAADK